jgi:hypothetical protein
MLRVAVILIQLIAETLRWVRLAFRSSRPIKAENLFLRRQLALYIERGVKPRSDHSDRSDGSFTILPLAGRSGCGAP